MAQQRIYAESLGKYFCLIGNCTFATDMFSEEYGNSMQEHMNKVHGLRLFADGDYCKKTDVINRKHEEQATAPLQEKVEVPKEKPPEKKADRVRPNPKVTELIAGYMDEVQLVAIRNEVYKLILELSDPSELHIHTVIAEEIAKQLKGRIISFGDHEVLAYNTNTGIWEDATQFLTAVSEAIYISNRSNRDEIIVKTGLQCFTKREDFDAVRARFIGFKNGCWDVQEWKFVSHDAAHCLVAALPVTYDEAATCPAIQKFLSEIVIPEDVAILEEWAGYCMLDKIFIHKALMLHGAGNNGKSVFINLLKTFLGEKNTTHISLQQLTSSNFAAANLYGKKANLYADLSQEALEDTGQFKILVGGDSISSDRKFMSYLTFTNTSKQIFSANTIPRTKDMTDGFFRRWCIVHFPNQFNGDNADKHLYEKVSTEAELSGFLNIALVGLKRLYDMSDFSSTKGTNEVRRTYQRLSDSISAFAEECVIQDEDSMKLPKQEWVEYYFAYCRKNMVNAATADMFFKRFPILRAVTETQVKMDDERVRVWKGIKISEELSKFVENERKARTQTQQIL